MKIRFIVYIFAFLSIVGWGPITTLLDSKKQTNAKKIESIVGSKNWMDNTVKSIQAQANNLDPKVLKLGLTAYLHARKQGLNDKQLLTLVDYTKSSFERRLWVIDLKNIKVLYNTWVAHGKNSGSRVKATSFSNKPQSLKSSIGVYLTDESYQGGNGPSMRVRGLEPNINSNAYDRSIVFHGAAYVKDGTVGRSYGCFAVKRNIIKPLINTIKNNTLVVAYYPEQNWLKTSDFFKEI